MQNELELALIFVCASDVCPSDVCPSDGQRRRAAATGSVVRSSYVCAATGGDVCAATGKCRSRATAFLRRWASAVLAAAFLRRRASDVRWRSCGGVPAAPGSVVRARAVRAAPGRGVVAWSARVGSAEVGGDRGEGLVLAVRWRRDRGHDGRVGGDRGLVLAGARVESRGGFSAARMRPGHPNSVAHDPAGARYPINCTQLDGDVP